MRKIVIRAPGGVEALELVDVPAPVPGPRDVVVEAAAIGVGWPDILIRRGTYKWMPTLPASPGSDLAGHVVAVGAEVDTSMLGQPVLVTARELPQRGGCYAERVCVPADAVFVLPPHLDVEAAVCLPNYQVAWNLVHEVERSRPLRSIFINGVAGGVGSAVAQIAKSAGMTVYGSVSSEAKAAFAREQGVDHAIDRTRGSVVAEVMRLSQGAGVDIAVDHVGGPGFAALIGLLAPWGTLVSYNASGGLPEENLLGELRRHGARCPAIRIFEMHVYDNDRENRRRIMNSVIAAWAEGRIRPIVSKRYAMEDVRQAHALLEKGDAMGKVILEP
ncbi:zinc-dependent alcohol dehydrogenase family protein [Ramlibacter sp.]|uniref:zinc-dependent alcohol dehydrogenase family protein n=1 Tax=Ramlibacter sp. TaxID=1917967 RepID=UPI003D12196C